MAFGGASLIVPLYVVELGGDAFELGILFAAASFVGVPGALIFGRLADRSGKRRRFVLVAMAIAVATMLLIPLLNRIAAVVIANALLWFGFAAALPVVTLLTVAETAESEWSRLIARLNKFQGIGWAGGLALGFVIIAIASRVVEPITAQRVFFVACAISASLGLVLARWRLPPDPSAGSEPEPRRLQRRLRSTATFNVRGASFPFTPSRFDPRQLRPRVFLDRFTPRLGLYYLAVLAFFTGFGIFFAPLPAFLTDLGYGSTEIFGLYLLLNVAAAAFFGRAAVLSERYSVIRVHIGGLAIRGVILPVVALIGLLVGVGVVGLGGFGMLFILLGITWAVIAVTAATLLTSLAPLAIRGEALGMYGALVAVGGGVGGVLGGLLAIVDSLLAFAVAGGMVVVGASIVFLVSRWNP